MSIKAANFKHILSTKYLPRDNISIIDSQILQNSRFENQFIEVYLGLGGKEKFPILNQKGYFFETIKFAVSFDDQLSFNKYRNKTLRSEVYESFHGFKKDKYRSFCNKYERECLKSGSSKDLWSNMASELHFGKSEAPGDLGLNGSSGWKYRAFQHFLEDIYALKSGIKLMRISVWDDILINKQLLKIGDLLNTPNKQTYDHILRYVERRVINLFA